MRPSFSPLPQAFIDTIRADPDILIREVLGLVTAEGLRVRSSIPEEGYLETDWYDVVAGRPTGPRASDRTIRLRFFADDIGEGWVLLTAEAVYHRTLDPSIPPRLAELMVPPEHEAEKLLQRILEAVKTRLGRD